jgi:hypothetical protein
VATSVQIRHELSTRLVTTFMYFNQYIPKPQIYLINTHVGVVGAEGNSVAPTCRRARSQAETKGSHSLPPPLRMRASIFVAQV